MSKANKTMSEKVPTGFKTCRQWAQAEDLSESHTQKLLRTLLNSTPPLVERRVFRITDNGALRKVPHYRKLQ